MKPRTSPARAVVKEAAEPEKLPLIVAAEMLPAVMMLPVVLIAVAPVMVLAGDVASGDNRLAVPVIVPAVMSPVVLIAVLPAIVPLVMAPPETLPAVEMVANLVSTIAASAAISTSAMVRSVMLIESTTPLAIAVAP